MMPCTCFSCLHRQRSRPDCQASALTWSEALQRQEAEGGVSRRQHFHKSSDWAVPAPCLCLGITQYKHSNLVFTLTNGQR